MSRLLLVFAGLILLMALLGYSRGTHPPVIAVDAAVELVHPPPDPAVLPYETLLCIDAGGTALTGSVSSAALRARALQIAARRFIGATDTRLTIRDDAPEGFPELLLAALHELTQLDSGCLAIRDATLVADGTIRSAEARDRLVEVLDAAAAEHFSTRYDLLIPRLSDTARACQDFFTGRLSQGDAQLFEFDRPDLHQAGRQLLDTIAVKVKECSGLVVTIAGHTDSVGDPAYNRELSYRRAMSVLQYLAGQGVDIAGWSAVGYGEAQARADNATLEGRAKNHRIEFRVRAPGVSPAGEMTTILPEGG